mgnify:CR=1 FL=1
MMRPRDLTLGRHPSERKALGTRMTISLDRKCRRSLRHDSASSLGSNTRIVIFEKRHQFAHCSYVHCLVFTLQRKTEENKTGCPFSLYGSQFCGGGLVSLVDCRTHIGHLRPNAKFSYLLRKILQSSRLRAHPPYTNSKRIRPFTDKKNKKFGLDCVYYKD